MENHIRFILKLINISVKQQAKLLFLFVVVISLSVIDCSGLSIQEEKDGLNRVIKKATFRRGKLKLQEEIKYFNNTDKPLIKVYKRLVKGAIVPWWMEVYSYDNDNIEYIDHIKFFITINEKRILSGKIDYEYESDQLKRIEYYSINNLYNTTFHRHGFDLYYYSQGKPVKRRIIEYEYSPKTKTSMQRSQYVIYYKGNKIKSMETKMLDWKSKKMITKDEKSINIITEMIRNIEKSLKDRCKGIRLLDN